LPIVQERVAWRTAGVDAVAEYQLLRAILEQRLIAVTSAPGVIVSPVDL
jgi:hypothetical protein